MHYYVKYDIEGRKDPVSVSFRAVSLYFHFHPCFSLVHQNFQTIFKGSVKASI